MDNALSLPTRHGEAPLQPITVRAIKRKHRPVDVQHDSVRSNEVTSESNRKRAAPGTTPSAMSNSKKPIWVPTKKLDLKSNLTAKLTESS